MERGRLSGSGAKDPGTFSEGGLVFVGRSNGTGRRIWLAIGGWVLSCGIVDFVVMGIDKMRAIDGRWRYGEFNLLLVAFMGGFGGLLAGSALFHHKTQKSPFIEIAYFAALIWIAILVEMTCFFGPPFAT